jgi:uncharacterized membrane protein
MSFLSFLPTLVGYILFALALIHALIDARDNRVQRLLMLLTLFIYGTMLEFFGVISGNYYYAAVDIILLFGIIPLCVSLAWVGIIYSVMIIAERLELSIWQRILATTLIALSLDWGMDPVAVELGAWTWLYKGGDYYGIPSFNFVGWSFIPLGYLVPYCLNWDKQSKKLQIVSIRDIEKNNTLVRKIYTILVVVPIAIGILMVVGIFARIPFIYDMPLWILIIWAILTVSISTLMIIWKRENLKRSYWYDLIPPSVLCYIALNYAIFGFVIGRYDLGILMLITGIPIWLIFIFLLRKK